ncbi:GntR family transcriptional regulator [Natranaerofaba carboxydovora]|uniref:GntR family transcriptional regulator n=1 Tax=Natranaerofaba carboxydovora TaxID=2742683 RepID=UPI001F130EE8|nr:GntR family transcriptional regulator [Natranaerofaba carboxydovora]UMZ72488.1 HTH-type transcriptional repressor YtrA [Natranaerofaba carboxydovora]
MIQLDLTDGRPLYEQIKEKLKFLIIRGALKPDERIPSVRELAGMLTINPNTIQKAYKDLETEGFIYSIRGKGSFVTPLNETSNLARKNELLTEFKKTALELIYLNVPKEELHQYIEEVYQQRGALDD